MLTCIIHLPEMDKCIARTVLQCSTIEEVLSKIKTTKSESLELAIQTKQQSSSDLWRHIRGHRVTASKCGEILNLKLKGGDLRKKAFKLFSKVCNGALLEQNGICQSNIPAPIKWGLEKESEARQLYLKNTPHFTCVEYGIFLSNSGILGASPDGILFRSLDDLQKACFRNAELLEIKCPYSKRLIRGKTQAQTTYMVMNSLKYIKQNKSGGYSLNTRNTQGFKYWHQVQMSMFITETKTCRFVIYTPNMLYEFEVKKDLNWYSLYGKWLEEEYWKGLYIPMVLDKMNILKVGAYHLHISTFRATCLVYQMK